MIQHQSGVTRLIDDWQNGDEVAGRAALAMVYGELRRLARRLIDREAPGHTLEPTALVHEAYLRLIGGKMPTLASRGDLVGIAARLMRQVLVNHALRRRTVKRGGDRRRVALDPALAVFAERCPDIVALDEALTRLETLDARQALVVELRFFGGMSVEETAGVLEISTRTVEREWTMARAWLRREIA